MKFGLKRSAIVSLGERLPLVGRSITRRYDRWLALKYRLNWNYLRNPAARRKLVRQKPLLTEVQRRVVDDLESRGIAFAQFSELFGEGDLWPQLTASVREFAQSEKVQAALREYRAEFERKTGEATGATLPSAGRRDVLKKYFITLYPDTERPTVPVSNRWLRLGVRPELLNVVNSYFGLWAKLIYFDLWHTVTVDTDRLRFGSQEWHRDPEDRRKIRLYLYFSRVDQGTGPLQYVPGSCTGGPYEKLWPWQGPVGTNYVPSGELERLIPSSQWVTCTGEVGTCVFCDTSGLHRGGVSTTQPRILANWAFVTPASLHRRRYRVGWSDGAQALLAPAKFAVT